MYFNQPSKYPCIDRCLEDAVKVQDFAAHNLERLDIDLTNLGVTSKWPRTPYIALFAGATVIKYTLILAKEF